ncbi:UAP56-interacting factor isoform X2 [Xenopus laevis]|uniref:UAP56-interacting factor isoform X2 n=1 Tax=Xenopus laevis TaxID=8355 RepID=A0A8J0TJK7_XENLA|nr:UAP56-interacting factor isoform X2 [Xenopus laevis]
MRRCILPYYSKRYAEMLLIGESSCKVNSLFLTTRAMEEQQDQQAHELQAHNKKIDMSLDDIIKLQNEPASDQSGQQRRNKSFPKKRFFRGVQTNQQGFRHRPYLKQQVYSGINLQNNGVGPITRRKAALLKGVSPLNRQNSNKQETPNSQRQPQTRGNRQQRQKGYRPASTPVQGLNRINTQNRRSQFNLAKRQQQSNVVNQSRGLTKQITPRTYARRWQREEAFGSTLTVSVQNPKASQMKKFGRPANKGSEGRFRKQTAKSTDPPPKGVPLRFNFRAMANHTNVTLNDRFSTFKTKGQFSTTPRRVGRTVMLA